MSDSTSLLVFIPPLLLSEPGHSSCYFMHRDKESLSFWFQKEVFFCSVSRAWQQPCPRLTQVRELVVLFGAFHTSVQFHSLAINSSTSNLLMLVQRCQSVEIHREGQGEGGYLLVNSRCQVELLLLSGTHGAVFAAEVMHHHAVGIPGERTERDRCSSRGCFIVGRIITCCITAHKQAFN